jgi:hypothetical protein
MIADRGRRLPGRRMVLFVGLACGLMLAPALRADAYGASVGLGAPASPAPMECRSDATPAVALSPATEAEGHLALASLIPILPTNGGNLSAAPGFSTSLLSNLTPARWDALAFAPGARGDAWAIARVGGLSPSAAPRLSNASFNASTGCKTTALYMVNLQNASVDPLASLAVSPDPLVAATPHDAAAAYDNEIEAWPWGLPSCEKSFFYPFPIPQALAGSEDSDEVAEVTTQTPSESGGNVWDILVVPTAPSRDAGFSCGSSAPGPSNQSIVLARVTSGPPVSIGNVESYDQTAAATAPVGEDVHLVLSSRWVVILATLVDPPFGGNVSGLAVYDRASDWWSGAQLPGAAFGLALRASEIVAETSNGTFDISDPLHPTLASVTWFSSTARLAPGLAIGTKGSNATVAYDGEPVTFDLRFGAPQELDSLPLGFPAQGANPAPRTIDCCLGGAPDLTASNFSVQPRPRSDCMGRCPLATSPPAMIPDESPPRSVPGLGGATAIVFLAGVGLAARGAWFSRRVSR